MMKLLRVPAAALLDALSLVGVSAAQEDAAARLEGLSRAAFEIAFMQEMDREMTALKTARGVEFDRKFAEDMIVHHQSAIEMAQLVAERAERAELKTLAQAIIGAQSHEIEQMRQWLQVWGPRPRLSSVLPGPRAGCGSEEEWLSC